MARVFDHTSIIDVKISSKMPRAKSKAVPEGERPFTHDEPGSGEHTIANIYRLLKEGFNKTDKYLEEPTGKMITTNQRLTGLTVASGSAAISHRGGRRKTRHEDPRAYGEHSSR